MLAAGRKITPQCQGSDSGSPVESSAQLGLRPTWRIHLIGIVCGPVLRISHPQASGDSVVCRDSRLLKEGGIFVHIPSGNGGSMDFYRLKRENACPLSELATRQEFV